MPYLVLLCGVFTLASFLYLFFSNYNFIFPLLSPNSCTCIVQSHPRNQNTGLSLYLPCNALCNFFLLLQNVATTLHAQLS